MTGEMARIAFVLVLVAFVSSGTGLPSPVQSSNSEVYDFGDRHSIANYGPNHSFEYGMMERPGETGIACTVATPDNNFYNLWPNFNVAVPNISAGSANGMGGCMIRFDRPSSDFDGTYNLRFLVSRTDGSLLLYTINYHLTFIPRQDVKELRDDTKVEVFSVMA